MNSPYHHLTLARERASLDGETLALPTPLEVEAFAADWAVLWIAANRPDLPQEVLEAASKCASSEQWLRDLGRRLYQVIPPSLAEKLADGRPIALSFEETPPDPEAALTLSIAGYGLSIPALSLSNLPWELLCDGRDYLARTRGLVRAVEAAGTLPSLPPPGDALRVLVAMASPIWNPDLPPDHAAQPAIVDLDREAQTFRALQGLEVPISLRLHLHVTREELRDELCAGCDVFHFLGHGNINVLALEDRYGREDVLPADRLREYLLNSGVRLGLLQSCLTAAEVAGVPSVARMLLEAGIPLVLAMGQSISVSAAQTFFRDFYRELAEGGDITKAACKARLAVADAADREKAQPWEWATPILFARREALEKGVEWKPRGEGRLVVDERPRFAPPDPSLRRNPFFVGRRKERVEVAGHLDPEQPTDRPVTVLHGERGIGKTALAEEVLFRWGWWFEETLWLQGRSELVPRGLEAHLEDYRSTALVGDIGTLLQKWASTLGIALKGDEPPKALVEPILGALAAEGRKRLVVLDNMDAFIGEEALLDLLRRLPANCRALVTCPIFPEGLNANRVEVWGLFPAEAVSLVGHQVEGAVPPEVAEELYRRIGGHPMALRLVAGWVRTGKRTWEEALEEVRKAKGDLFDYIFTRSLELAGERGRRLFRLLALFAPDASREAWRAAVEMETVPFGDAVALLLGLSLVEDRGEVEGVPYYGLSPLARAVAEREAAPQEWEEGRGRMAAYYREWLEEKAPKASGPILEKEAGNLRLALEHLERKEGRETIKGLLGRLLQGVERAFEEGKAQWEKV